MNSKNLIYFFTFLIFTTVNAQRQFIKIDFEIKSQKLTELEIEKKKTNLIKDCLNYHCKNNLKLSYCNNNSDENYVNFYELGNIKNSKISVIHKTTYNEEFYILINKNQCKAVTLNGFPLKIENSNQYIVYNNPPTDNPYIIQIVDITNETVKIQDEIILPEYIVPKKILRIENFEVFILDDKNQIWKSIIKK